MIMRHTRLTALCQGLPGWAGTRKVKPIWILLKQETVSGSGISWAICKSASRSRQTTMPAPHHSVFYRPDALPATQPTASKHWRDQSTEGIMRQSLDILLIGPLVSVSPSICSILFLTIMQPWLISSDPTWPANIPALLSKGQYTCLVLC